MTTAITTTTPSANTATTSKPWKLVATFVAGVALASGVAIGVNAAHTDSSPTPATSHVAVSASAGPSDLGCRVHPGPC